MDDLKDSRWYCELKEEAADRTVWRNRFARGFGPVVWQITDDDDDDDVTYKCARGLHNTTYRVAGWETPAIWFEPMTALL